MKATEMMNHLEKTFIRCKRQGGFALPFIVLLAIIGIFAACPAVQAATDVSGQVKINYTNPFYNRATMVQSYDVTLTNIGTAPIAAPLKVVIESLSSAQVTVANPDGTTEEGKPYFDCSSLLGDGSLSPQETSQVKKWQFNNPTRVRFTIQTRVLAGAADTTPPTITINSPANGATINNPLPFILIQYSDSGSGIDPASLNVKLNGADISNQFTKTAQSASFQTTTVLPQGQNIIIASIRDLAGNTQTAQSSFTISYLLPIITITNPVDGGNISTARPFITILFKDDLSGIDPNSCVIEINGVDRTSLFTITETKAAALYDGLLPPGPNDITVTVSNDYGLANSASSHFTVSSSSGINWYFFSLLGNSWIFTSPGDGTYNEYLRAEELGVDDTDITSFDISGTGNHYFTQAGDNQILESLGAGFSNRYLTNAQIGLTDSEYVNALQLLADDRVAFSIFGQQNIFASTGDNTKSLLLTNTALGVPGQEITAFHQGYNGRYYFAVTGMDGILESTGNGSNTPFLTSADLGVEGSVVDAFAVVPDTTPPAMMITNPVNGTTIDTRTPLISISFSDPDSGIDLGSFSAKINGADCTSSFNLTPTGASYQLTTPLPVGNNTITVKIKDKAGNETVATSQFTVDVFLVAIKATPTKGGIPLETQFVAEVTGGTAPITFAWDLDGNGTTGDTRQSFSHVYQTYGVVQVTLVSRDGRGRSVSDTEMIYALSAPSVVASANPSTGSAPLDVELRATISDPDGTITRYEWDFDGNGTYDWSSTNTATITHRYETVGLYHATLRVTDNDGLTGIDSVTIAVGGSPTATAAANPMTGNAPLPVNFTGSGSDPDGTIALYEWDFDGDSIYDWSSPSSGSTSHTYPAAGIFNATLRVTDNNGLIDTDSVLISIAGPPIAKPRAFPTEGNTPLKVTFFSDGEDLDGSPEYFDWDFNGDGVYDQHLIASMNTTYTYSQPGTYAATLKVTDNDGLTGTATVTITVADPNASGVTTALAGATPTNGGAPLGVALVGEGTDPNGTITKYEWDFEGDGVYDWEEAAIGSGPVGLLINAGSYSTPRMVDIDNDGDLDLFVGEYYGRIYFYRNDGSRNTPVWTTVGYITNSGNTIIDVGSYSSPALVDIDGDGDLDLFVGESGGRIYFYRNDGTSNVPVWTAVGYITNSGNTIIDVGSNSSPALVDIDGDDDLDLYVGEYGGRVYFYRNSGTSSSPVWSSVGLLANSGGTTIDIGSYSHPAFADMDGDGDFDLFIGEYYGKLYYFRNDGDVLAPRWILSSSSYRSIDLAYRSSPAIVDIDNDGDKDLFLGDNYGQIYFYPTAGYVFHTYNNSGDYNATLRVTDNVSMTDTDAVVIHVYDSGSPSARASATPTSGNVPLAVSFSGSGTDKDGTISLYEWDFDGNGTYDWSSSTSGSTSYTYSHVDTFNANLRVTDNDGKTATDAITIKADLLISTTRTTIFNPTTGDVGAITLTINNETTFTIKIIDSAGNVVRLLLNNESRPVGTYSYTWDGKDDLGNIVRDGVYYFLVEYIEDGMTKTFDPRTTAQYTETPPSRSWPSTFDPFSDDYVEVTYSMSKPGEVSLYFWKRDYSHPGSSIAPVRTLFVREPKAAGSHTEIWDGIDDNGAVVGPWVDGGYPITLWTYDLSDNAIIIIGNTPEITEVSAAPNYFSPAYNPYGSSPTQYTLVAFNLSKQASVEVRIVNQDGILIDMLDKSNMPAGANTIIWDGKDLQGNLVTAGSYSISLRAVDAHGNRSLPRYAAVIVHY